MKSVVLVTTEDRISRFATTNAGMTVLPEGSVLMVTRSGILSHTFPVLITRIPTAINQDIKAVLPSSFLDGRYLAYNLRSKEREILRSCTKEGTTVASVETNLLENLPLPLAPLNEQKRIADKLDAVLARVDACRERLDRIPAILKRFRQSVLAAATSGKLTEEWRTVRRLKEWPSSTVGESSSLVTKGASPKWQGISYVDDPSQTLFVTSENVGQGQMLLNEKKYVENEFNKKQARSMLKRGDVLTNIVGASIGRAAIYDRDVLANINQAVCVIRVDDSKLSNKFLMYFLNSPQGVANIIGGAVEVARANVSLGTISNLAFKLPTLDEQTEIVRRVEDLFAYANRLEARYTASRALVETLTPALLAKAFRGELVPQDPNDEPASVLLERIRASRADTQAKPKQRRSADRGKPVELELLPMVAEPQSVYRRQKRRG